MQPSNLIEHAIAAGESSSLELLRSADLSSITTTVAALLNSGGGTVLIGVEGDGTVIGIPATADAARAIEKELSAVVTPPADWSVHVERVGDAAIIQIDVPEGSSKPYAASGRILVRSGAKNEVAQQQDILRLLTTRQREDKRWERLPALGLSIEDLDSEELFRTAKLASDRMPGVSQVSDPYSILDALNLTDDGDILNGAVVLFGKRPEKRFPQTRVRVARFRSDEMTELDDNRSIEGHLFHVVAGINAFLSAHIPIASSLDTSGYQRADRPAYPQYAIREGLMNALVHRDYSQHDGGVSVGIYPQRIEIWNAGTLPPGLAPSTLSESSVSRPQNPDIAHVFFLRGLIERWGIGTRRIALECARAGLPAPRWDQVGGGVRLTLQLRTEVSKTEEVLNSRQHRFLRSQGDGSQIDVQDYWREYASGVTERTARRDLSTLAELGYITLALRGQRQVYARTEKVLPREAPSA